MRTRLIIAVATVLFLAPILPAFAQEHPENKVSGAEKKVTTAAISAGIKKVKAKCAVARVK